MSETDKMMNSGRDHSRIRAAAVDDCSGKRVTLRNKRNKLVENISYYFNSSDSLKPKNWGKPFAVLFVLFLIFSSIECAHAL